MRTNANKTVRLSAIIMAVLMLATSLCACGKAVTIDIKDMNETTQIETKTGKTVEKVLTDAEIILGEKDKTEPALDEKITEDTKSITIKRYAKVTIINKDVKTEVELVGGTVEDALKEAKIELKDKETTDIDAKEYLTDGMTINILMAKSVTLVCDGKTSKIDTTAQTVEELLALQKVTLSDDDEVSEKLDTEIKDGMKVVVKRVTYKEETVTETIDYETEAQYSDSMAEGTSEVKQSGVQGKKEVTYKIKYVDGKKNAKEVLNEKIIKEAQNEIVVYGTQSSSSGSSDSGSSNTGRYETHRVRVDDCDGSGHGYYEIYYSDGSVEYEAY